MSSSRRYENRWNLDIIRAIPLEEVAQSLGLSTRRGSSNCPLPSHPDKNPSFKYWLDTNSWKCFGCDKGGTTIDLVMAVKDYEFVDAARFLHENFIGKEFKPHNVERIKSQPFLTIPKVGTSASKPFLDSEVYGFLCQHLRITEKLTTYFERRSISLETLKKFKIGEIGDLSEVLENLIGTFGYQRVERSGLLSKSSSSQNPRLINLQNRAVFPFFCQGVCEYIQARKMDESNIGRWLNLSNVNIQPYNRDALFELDIPEIYICEGITDALSAAEMGLSAIAILGASNRIPEEDLFRYKNREVYLVADNDNRGNAFAKKIEKQLAEIGVPAITQSFPFGCNDLNEYLVAIKSGKGR